MKELNIFSTYASNEFDVFFQKEAAIDTEVDVYYLKYGEDEINNYVNNVVKPELNEFVEGEREKLVTYHIDLDNSILSLSGTNVQTSTVDLSNLSFPDRYVTLNTQQNIDVLKTFTQNPVVSKNSGPALNVQNTSILFGRAPAENQISSINFVDSAKTLMGALKNEVLSNGSLKTSLTCANLEADEYSEIEIGYDENGNVYTKAPIPSTATSAQDDKIATTGWVNSTGNNVVHLDSDEIITGTKTFASAIRQSKASTGITANRLQNTAITKGTVPDSGTAVYNEMNDSTTIAADSGTVSGVYYGMWDNGSSFSSLVVYKPELNSTTRARVELVYPISGNPYATAPTPAVSDNSTKIATTAWVNSQGYVSSADEVTIATAQTITGEKTFSSNLNVSTNGNSMLKIQKTNMTKGTAPVSGQWQGIKCVDSTGANMAYFRQQYSSSKDNRIEIICYKGNASTDTESAHLDLVYPASGTPYAVAPASDVANSILTTKSILKSQNGYCKLGNGIIIQWGYYTPSASPYTVSLNTAFTSADYSVIVTSDRSSGGNDWYGQVNSLTTTAFTYVSDGAKSPMHWIAIGY